MATYVFATSVVVLVGNFFTMIAGCFKSETLAKLCQAITGCGALAFVANIVWIPIVLFADWSKPCYKAIDDGGLGPRPLLKEYKGFLAIWIVLLVGITFCVIMTIVMTCCTVCLAAMMARQAAKT